MLPSLKYPKLTRAINAMGLDNRMRMVDFPEFPDGYDWDDIEAELDKLDDETLQMVVEGTNGGYEEFLELVEKHSLHKYANIMGIIFDGELTKYFYSDYHYYNHRS